MEFLVKSLRVEKTKTYDNREEIYEDNLIYILNCVGIGGQRYEVRLWEEHGDCYSGWCPASWGHCSIYEVDSFIGMTHKLKCENLSFEIELDEISDGDIDNNIFSVSYNDHDTWYPSGFINVNMDLFEEINRSMPKRPVWIFKGASCLGKSYLAGIIANSDRMKTVYETDAHETLTDIHEDIIVVGNKYNHSIEDIENHILDEHETIFVDFSKIEG